MATALLIILLCLGIVLASVPVGIVSIVNCSRVKGKVKAITLPISIVAFLINLYAFVAYLTYSISGTTTAILYFLTLGAMIAALSVSVHYRRKANNKIFDDKKKEHEESVRQALKKEEVEIDYIIEIQKLKELLDSGAITQEEYDAKKNKILNRK